MTLSGTTKNKKYKVVIPPATCSHDSECFATLESQEFKLVQECTRCV